MSYHLVTISIPKVAKNGQKVPISVNFEITQFVSYSFIPMELPAWTKLILIVWSLSSKKAAKYWTKELKIVTKLSKIMKSLGFVYGSSLDCMISLEWILPAMFFHTCSTCALTLHKKPVEIFKYQLKSCKKCNFNPKNGQLLGKLWHLLGNKHSKHSNKVSRLVKSSYRTQVCT